MPQMRQSAREPPSSPAGNFKQRLVNGQTVTVVNPDHPSAGLVEFLGQMPVDAVFIDCEQGSPDVETVEHMARAARLSGCASLVRLFSSEDWVIERFMGRGIDGIVVPRLETANQALQTVEAVRYCLPSSHADKIIVIQIETANALETLDAFLAVDGIDIFFLGPVDLAKAYGHMGDYRHPAMRKRIDAAIAHIRKIGRPVGMLVSHDDVRDYVGLGVQFLYTHANDFLRIGADAFAGEVGAGRFR
jgi:2-keto-3-deoxy-L-rhamnonate aldolase RhmA